MFWGVVAQAFRTLTNPERPWWLAIIMIAVSAGDLSADPDALGYRERTGDSVEYLTATERIINDTLELSSRSTTRETHIVMAGEDLESLSWTHRHPAEDTEYTAVRDGRTIEVSGRSQGEEVAEIFTLRGEAPWIQSIERSLREFALSEDRRMEFWTIQPGDIQLRKLQALRRGRDTVAVDDTPTDAWEIRLSLPGIASLFWSATYWFRTSDGLFVRSEAVRGWPGTPVTVVELVEEAVGSAP